jgi:hypothetical protein
VTRMSPAKRTLRLCKDWIRMGGQTLCCMDFGGWSEAA